MKEKVIEWILNALEDTDPDGDDFEVNDLVHAGDIAGSLEVRTDQGTFLITVRER